MKHYLKTLTVMVPLLLAGLHGSGEAALVSVTDSRGDFVGTSVTFDETSGLEWLDLTLSLGRSVADLRGDDGTDEFGSGGNFASWRYATPTEIRSLFINAPVSGLPFNFSFSNSASSTDLAALSALVGITSTFFAANIGTTAFQIQGLLPGTNPLEVGRAYARGFQDGTSGLIDFTQIFQSSIAVDQGVETIGNWLVRDPSLSAVPLPAAFPLFAGGLGLLGLLGWRRKRMAAA